MDNEQKRINQIRAEVNKPQGTLLTLGYSTPQSSPALPVRTTTEVVCPVGHDLLNQIRAVVREELQREQSRDRSGTVHICIDGQWYQGDLYPTEDEEANG